mmetsp:Transcript_67415/g.152574  ORF Transcript_67415/g.152574 Transcript_67415/m.152574 type:complete len:771 (+) Transcript_67415:1202-3514(+)
MVRPRQPAVRLRLGLRAEDFGQPGLAHRLTGLVPRDRLGPRLGPCLEGVEPAGLVEEAAELGLGLLPWAPATGLPRRQRVEHRLSQVLVGRQLRGRGQGRGLGRRAAQVARGATNGGAARARLVLPDDVLLRVELALHALAALELPRHPPDVHLVDHLEVHLHLLVDLVPVPRVGADPDDGQKEAHARLQDGVVHGEPLHHVPVPGDGRAEHFLGEAFHVARHDSAHRALHREEETHHGNEEHDVEVEVDVRVEDGRVGHLRDVPAARVLKGHHAQKHREVDADPRAEVVGPREEGGEARGGEEEDHHNVVADEVAGLPPDDARRVDALEAAQRGWLFRHLPVHVSGEVEIGQLLHARGHEEALVVARGNEDSVHGILVPLVEAHDDLQGVHVERELVQLVRVAVQRRDLIRVEADSLGGERQVPLPLGVNRQKKPAQPRDHVHRLLVGGLDLLPRLFVHPLPVVELVLVHADAPHARPVRARVHHGDGPVPRAGLPRRGVLDRLLARGGVVLTELSLVLVTVRVLGEVGVAHVPRQVAPLHVHLGKLEHRLVPREGADGVLVDVVGLVPPGCPEGHVHEEAHVERPVAVGRVDVPQIVQPDVDGHAVFVLGAPAGLDEVTEALRKMRPPPHLHSLPKGAPARQFARGHCLETVGIAICGNGEVQLLGRGDFCLVQKLRLALLLAPPLLFLAPPLLPLHALDLFVALVEGGQVRVVRFEALAYFVVGVLGAASPPSQTKLVGRLWIHLLRSRLLGSETVLLLGRLLWLLL